MKPLAHTAIVAALAIASPSAAAAQPFTGSITGLGVTGPDPTCGSLPFRGTITGATGTSTLGALTYNHSICLNGAPGISVGTFSLLIGADSIIGSLTGTATPSGTAGISDTNFSYLITDGTGALKGAKGAFTGIGTADANFRPAHIAINFSGAIVPVPEPASWLLLIAGFGMLGAALRRSAIGDRSIAAVR